MNREVIFGYVEDARDASYLCIHCGEEESSRARGLDRGGRILVCLRVSADTNDDSCVEYGVLRGECIGCYRIHVAPSRKNDGGVASVMFRQYLNSYLTFNVAVKN
ncbi:uncharacterized protein LOC105283789 [Ooceraea biroi]|uniref:uncharacterized protein LOC105283789 n=1 Tax=Ooceraea biroi TaxID=2015173 RepID=UPI0005B85F1F|nr:uncharacterized protein LOC105283789 [Ooceraea biroi]